LGGNFTGGAGEPPVKRTCTVPRGTALFFPIINGVWASTPAPNDACKDIVAADPWYRANPGSPAFQQFLDTIYEPAGMKPDNPETNFSLKIDGKPIEGLTRYYARSDIFFQIQLPDDNIFDALIGRDCFPSIPVAPNVGWGYHVFVFPLPPGEHTLRWTAGSTLLPPLQGRFHQDVTYRLTVE
jgi:hypothetical protein